LIQFKYDLSVTGVYPTDIANQTKHDRNKNARTGRAFKTSCLLD